MNKQNINVAIIGSGPSGFYAAERLLKKNDSVSVYMIDQLLTPFGLLRGGVAPDHQKMKSVASAYEKIAASDRFFFIGGIHIGTDISIQELKQYFHAIVIATGANSDKPLNIEGKHLKGYHSATSFVGWYNSHPHFQDQSFDLNVENIAIIGQGNVAVDVARVLAKTNQELENSDISLKALSSMSNKAFKNIYLIGRRGPVQSAFTELEIKELASLNNACPYVDPEDLILSDADKEELSQSLKARKNYAALQDFTEKPQSNTCTIHIKFFRSPCEIIGDQQISNLKLEKNILVGEPGTQRTQGTKTFETIKTELIFTSIGYKGSPISGLPFNQNAGTIPNIGGRIVENDSTIPRFYTVGWIKRGPNGVIGTNRKDSFETIDNLLDDLEILTHPSLGLQAFKEKIQHLQTVTFSDWKKIDAIETQRGQKLNKPRLKFTNNLDILAHLDKGK